MGAVRLVAAFEMRRRWLSILAVALMVALVVAAVAAALAGARRTSSSVGRFREWAHASDGWFQTTSIEEAASLHALLATRADVAAFAERRLVNGFVVDRPISDIALITDPEGRYGVDVDRPRILSGRMPARGRPDEIALNELAARLARVHVGDILQIKTWSEDDLKSLFGGNGFPGFNGPRARMQVVGVVRTPDGLPGEIARTSPYGLASPAFLTKYRTVGAWPPAVYVRTANADAFARLSAALAATPSPGDAGRYSAGTPVRTIYLDASQKAVNSASWALVAFAIAAAIAGAIVIGQAVFRYLSGGISAEFLGHLGMTRSEIASAYTVPVVAAAVIGVVLGMLGAVLASPLLPIGLARRAEIDPGIRIDPLVLLAGSALGLALVCGFAFVAARRAAVVRQRSTPLRRRPSSGASLSPVVATGLRFAVERRTGARTLPVRTAFAALVVAVAGVAAASVVTTSFSRLSTQPARWGWNWSSEPDYFGTENVATLERRLVHDDRVSGVGELATDGVMVNNVQVGGWAMKSYKGDMALTLRRGRLPAAATDIALGEGTLARTKTHIGDSVRVSALNGTTRSFTTRSFTVVGTAVFRSQSETPVLDDGVAFTSAGFDSIAKNSPDIQASLELRYPPGADVAAVEAALTKDYGLQFNDFTVPQVPGVVRRLADTRSVAVALAVFFAVLGVVALAHSLVVGTGGRRLQIGVLRTLGFRPGQVRAAVAVQATAFALAATAIGLPVGIALGRYVWHAITGDLGALDAPATPWLLVALAVPTSVLCATAVAAWPARAASRARIADALHVE